MALAEVCGETYHVADQLMVKWRQISNGQLAKEDDDRVFIVDGRERCQPKGSKVLMANGEWKSIEDVKEGDIVLSPQSNGKYVYAVVIKTHSWFSDRTYNILELNRQEKKLYSCAYNHEIPINERRTFRNETKNHWIIKQYEAEDLFNRFKSSKRFAKNSTTPTMLAVDNFKDRIDCEIEPYTLGVFLGDGSYRDKVVKRKTYVGKSIRNVSAYQKELSSGKVLNVSAHQSKFSNSNDNGGYIRSRALAITSANSAVMEEISKFYNVSWIYRKKGTTALAYNFSVVGNLSNQLEKYNLNGKGSGEKFIPKEALLSNIEYRKRLLAGLIDTDGYLSKGESYSITTKSKQLADDILFLVFSLGGRASIRKIKKGIKSTGFVGEYYHVGFYIGNLKLPLQVEKKIKNGNIFYLSANRTAIKLEKDIGKQVYGFTLDSDSHYYITDNFCVTKNCGKSVFAMQQAGAIDPQMFEEALQTKTLPMICFTGNELLSAIRNTKSTTERTRVIIFDEAFRGLASSSVLSKTNRMIVQALMEMGQNNLVLFIVLPSFFLLDRYPAALRSHALMHIYKQKGKLKRRKFLLFNYDKKNLLFKMDRKKAYGYPINTRITGAFFNKYPGGKEIEEIYRRKKLDAFREIEGTLSGEKPTDKQAEKLSKYVQQRYAVLSVLHEQTKLNWVEISKLLKRKGCSISPNQLSVMKREGDAKQMPDEKEGASPEKSG